MFVSHELAEPREVVDQILFDGLELRAIIEAASCDRLWPTDFLQLCIRKWDDPGMRVDRDIAMQGALGQPAIAAELSVAELLRRLGATLIGLELESGAAAGVELAA